MGLRYYLDNAAAKSDRWVQEISTSLVRRRSVAPYHRVYHFKELNKRGEIERRELVLPGPNEALAEGFLIEECSRRGGPFTPHANVFSYWPSRPGEKTGIFVDYVAGLKQRHAAITAACLEMHDATLCFRDIRKFYPSLRIENVLRIWGAACEAAGLDELYRELGQKLLSDYGVTGGGHLLTGPMFSHLIGNLYLRSLDDRMSAGPAKYMRYVDDIALVGTPDAVKLSLRILEAEIERLELTLHGVDSPKSMEITKREWLGDPQGQDVGSDWMHLISDIKKFLLWYPSSTDELRAAMIDEDLRLPVPDYSVVVRESMHVERALRFLGWGKYRRGLQDLRVHNLVQQAKKLRLTMQEEFDRTLAQVSAATNFTAKRLFTRCRYFAGRLMYVADSERLGEMSRAMKGIPELTFHSAVSQAVSSRNVDCLVDLGVNAAQAASQTLRASARTVSLTRRIDEPWERQVVSILAINGISVETKESLHTTDTLQRFATEGASRDLMKSEDPYFSELACLHGLHGRPRHQAMMETAFDPAQGIVLDAIEQARESISV